MKKPSFIRKDATVSVVNGGMWNDGRKLTLSRLLEYIPANEWDWYLYEIDAVGTAPHKMSMQDFEEQVLASATGMKFSWYEVKALADSLCDLKNVFMAALLKPVEYEFLCNGELDSCLALVIVSDSTKWQVKII